MSSKSIVLDQDVVVTQLQGKVYLVAADGSQTLLSEGDVLPKDAVLLAPEGASFQGGETTFTLSPSNTPESEEPQLAQGDVPDDIAALQQAILAGTDPTQAFEASAAGGAPAAGNVGGVAGASGNGGFITIDRTGDATISTAGFDSANPDDAAPLAEAQDDEDELLDLTAPTITVSAPDNINDSTPTLTGTTDAAPGSTVTLVVTDANGNQQTLITTVNPDGSFSVDVETPLPDGGYDVTASVTDPAGNTGTATDDGSVAMKCPTEIAIDDRREAELAKLGMMPILHRKNTDVAAFIGAHSLQDDEARAGRLVDPDAQANERLSANLPYLFPVSRFAHYLKAIARDKVGTFKERGDMQKWLSEWINRYVLANPAMANDSAKAKRPLAAADLTKVAWPGDAVATVAEGVDLAAAGGAAGATGEEA